jgi:hypothetical protein
MNPWGSKRVEDVKKSFVFHSFVMRFTDSCHSWCMATMGTLVTFLLYSAVVFYVVIIADSLHLILVTVHKDQVYLCTVHRYTASLDPCHCAQVHGFTWSLSLCTGTLLHLILVHCAQVHCFTRFCCLYLSYKLHAAIVIMLFQAMIKKRQLNDSDDSIWP